MQDKLLIVTKVKKTIEYLEKITCNFPNKEYVLKNKIIETSYNILELTYKANIHKEIVYIKDIIVKIRMLEYYIKISLDKKIINYKKYENIGNHLLEINKMIVSWSYNEKNKQSL